MTQYKKIKLIKLKKKNYFYYFFKKIFVALGKMGVTSLPHFGQGDTLTLPPLWPL